MEGVEVVRKVKARTKKKDRRRRSGLHFLFTVLVLPFGTRKREKSMQAKLDKRGKGWHMVGVLIYNHITFARVCEEGVEEVGGR